jgi:hypothetical protein
MRRDDYRSIAATGKGSSGDSCLHNVDASLQAVGEMSQTPSSSQDLCFDNHLNNQQWFRCSAGWHHDDTRQHSTMLCISAGKPGK